ncbi:hypothetical protein [Absidia glauca]|uniref:rRNA biogenesis protein RRP36 n=1 Tax=Absidia glauca TaxID=4829 RepID=A0A163IUQ3_ABSGL|nr:hypothetical protein [Absidia glauca]
MKHRSSDLEEEDENDYGYDYSDDDGSEQDTSDNDNLDDQATQASKTAQLDKLKRSLAHVSFEQLAEIKNKMGIKEFSQTRTTKATTANDAPKKAVVSKAQILKDLREATGQRARATKEEMKRDSKHRDVVETASTKRRDPRFDKLSGQFNQDLFEKSYGFIDDYKQSEIADLKTQLTKTKDPEEQERLKSILTRMKSQEMAAANTKRRQALARERKKVESELVKQGKTPYFLKNSEKRKLELVDKYNQLGDKSMERILEKRRKRNANKDHKRVPFVRRSGGTN